MKRWNEAIDLINHGMEIMHLVFVRSLGDFDRATVGAIGRSVLKICNCPKKENKALSLRLHLLQLHCRIERVHDGSTR